jgi:hypothetical protein
MNISSFIEAKMKQGDKEGKQCLKEIGTALNKDHRYFDLDSMVKAMDDDTMERLEKAIERVKFNKKRFCQWETCTKKQALNMNACHTHSTGYKLEGEFGGEYGYFKYLKPLTEEQEEWIIEFTECCYYSGQPCQGNQDGTAEEDCECILGKEYASLILTPLGDEYAHIKADNWKLGD